MSRKDKPLLDRLRSRLKDDSYLLDEYTEELKTLTNSKPPNEFKNAELDHIVRIIKNKTKDLIYYYYAYINLDYKERISPTEKVNVLRQGCPIIGKTTYKNRGKRVSKSLSNSLNNMEFEHYKKIRPQYIEFYLEIYPEKEAYERFNVFIKNRSEISKKSVIKSNEYRRNNTESNNAHIDFYIKKNNGDIELANLEYKERQGTCSLKNYIKRMGAEEGYRSWRKRQRVWQNTLNSKPKEEICRINKLKVAKGFPNNTSNESNKFFNKIQSLFDCELIYGSKGEEFSISYNGVNNYYYDCVIPEYNVIIEYHGLMFHPKPMQYDWVSYLDKLSYKKSRLYDLRKRKVARDNGYIYICVWSDEDFEKSVRKIKRAINGRITELI